MDNPAIAPQSTHVIQRIQWHDGMLISPHHFQQQDLRFDQLLSLHMQAVSPFYWGIKSLSWDPSTLPDGLVRILSVEAIFPDTLCISLKESDPPLELDISKQAGLDGSFFIYICVPKRPKQDSSVAGENPRFVSVEGEDILDDNTFDNPIRIPRLVPRIFLKAGQELPANVEGFPLMKVTFRDDAFIEEPFIPPVLRVRHMEALWKRCMGLLQSMREKVVFLSTRLQNHSHDAWTHDTSTTLRALINALTPLEATVHTPDIHPKDLYFQLTHTLAHLSTTRLGFVMPSTAGYNHNAIYKSFNQVLIKIENLVERIDQNVVVIPFVKKDRFFSLKVNASYTQKDLIISAKACSGMTLAELETWCMNVVIASESQVNIVRERRVSGAERTLLSDEALLEYLPGRGVLLMSVKATDPFIINNEHVSVFNPADFPHKRPSEVALFLKTTQEDENTSHKEPFYHKGEEDV
jgi:type VI secretion system protein ImpJ